MRLEDQVPDRELCEELKKAGMPQDATFFWLFNCKEEWHLHRAIGDEENITGWKQGWPDRIIAAPTIAEMGEMMPHHLHSRGDYWGFTVEKVGTGWACTYSNETWDYLRKEQDEKEANARAKLLLWAIQNGHVK